MKYYVYTHRKADTREIFYVGEGQDDRAWRYGRSSPVWRNIVKKHGYFVEIIDYFENEIDALIFENHLILLYGRRNIKTGPLVNLTDGGLGKLGYVTSDKTKELMSSHRKGKKWEEIFGVEKAAEMREEKSKITKGSGNSMFGVNPWNKGTLGVQKSPWKNTTYEYRYGEEKAKELRYKKSNQTKFIWFHIKFGNEICTRYELVNRYPEQNLRSYELKKVAIKDYAQHRGWQCLGVSNA
jgi:hypothetical protein